MDWLGESLTNIKGQISSFTKDVLTPEPIPNQMNTTGESSGSGLDSVPLISEDMDRIKTFNIHLNELCKHQKEEIELLQSKSLELQDSLETYNRQADSFKEVIHAKEVENERLRKELQEFRNNSMIPLNCVEIIKAPASEDIPIAQIATVLQSNYSNASTETEDLSFEELHVRDLEERCNSYQNDLYLLRAELMAVQHESDQKDESSAKFKDDLFQFLLTEFSIDGQSIFPRSIKIENDFEQINSWLKELAYQWRNLIEKKSTLERQVTRLSLSGPLASNNDAEDGLINDTFNNELFYPSKIDSFGLETIVEEDRSEDEGPRSDSAEQKEEESLHSLGVANFRIGKGTPSPAPTVFSSNSSTQTEPEADLIDDLAIGEVSSLLLSNLEAPVLGVNNVEVNEVKVLELKCQNQNLQSELDRLRTHLVELEEQYTNDALANEEKIQVLQDQVIQLKNELSQTIQQNIHSYGIRDEMSKLAEERTMYKRANANFEEQVQKLNSQLQNLYFVLEQFQKEKETEINAVENRFKAEIVELKNKNEMLKAELEREEGLLEKAKNGLDAAHQLNIQIEEKGRIIQQLKAQAMEKDAEILKLRKDMDEVSNNIGGKVDRYLIKNLFVGYFSTPSDKRNEVLRLIATVLDFNREDRQKTGLESSSSLWPFSKFSSNSTDSQSLSEAFIHFLENESKPKIQVKMSVDELARRNSKSGPGGATQLSNSISTVEPGTNSPNRSSPIPAVPEISMELPVLSQIDRSNSILKDVLSPKP